jgi:hypothetical protein
MQTAAGSKAGRHRRADVGNSGAVKLMKIAAAKAMESAADKPGREDRGAGVETRPRMNASGAKLTKPWTTTDGRRARINRVSRHGMRNDDAVVTMAPTRRANDWGDGAASKTVVPLIATRIIAGAVRAIVVPAIGVVLDCLDGG